jgi:hypothetical protein
MVLNPCAHATPLTTSENARPNLHPSLIRSPRHLLDTNCPTKTILNFNAF